MLEYVAWTVVSPGENMAQVGAACSCACFDSLRCRAYSMHMIKKGNLAFFGLKATRRVERAVEGE